MATTTYLIEIRVDDCWHLDLRTQDQGTAMARARHLSDLACAVRVIELGHMGREQRTVFEYLPAEPALPR